MAFANTTINPDHLVTKLNIDQGSWPGNFNN